MRESKNRQTLITECTVNSLLSKQQIKIIHQISLLLDPVENRFGSKYPVNSANKEVCSDFS